MRRRAEAQDRAVGQVDDRRVGHGPVVDRRRGGGAGEGDGEPPAGPDGEAAEEDLERRERGVVPDEPGAEAVRAEVGGAGAGDADGRVPRAALVLDEDERTGGEHLEGAAHGVSPTATKRTVLPGASSAGGSRSTSHRTASVVPRSCHPPGDDLG